MTPRPHAWTRRTAAAWLLALTGLLSLAGCDPRTLLYFLQPYEPTIPPPEGSPALKGKRVVIVATTASGTQTEFYSLDRDLVRELSQILRKKVKNIDVVNPDRVWDWVEAHPNWTNPGEVADKFEADFALCLEVEQFQIQSPGDIGVLHGSSRIHVKAFERAHPKNSRGKELTDKPMETQEVFQDFLDLEFPKRGAIPADSGTSRGKFQNMFLKVVATNCSWFFVEHAPEDTIDQERFMAR